VVERARGDAALPVGIVAHGMESRVVAGVLRDERVVEVEQDDFRH